MEVDEEAEEGRVREGGSEDEAGGGRWAPNLQLLGILKLLQHRGAFCPQLIPLQHQHQCAQSLQPRQCSKRWPPDGQQPLARDGEPECGQRGQGLERGHFRRQLCGRGLACHVPPVQEDVQACADEAQDGRLVEVADTRPDVVGEWGCH